MKKAISLLLSIVMLFSITVEIDFCGYSQVENAETNNYSDSEYASDRVIVSFKDNVNTENARKILDADKYLDASQEIRNNVMLAELQEGVSISEAIKKLESNDNIEKVEPDYIKYCDGYTNDPEISSSKYSDNKDKYHYIFKMGLAGSGTTAWDYSTGKNIKIAVLDSGANVNHKDLKDNIAGCYNAVTKQEGKSYVTDTNGHGSKTAGIICAAGNNKVSAAGVAYNAKLYVVKVDDDDGDIYESATIEGIHWAVKKGCRVISISYGGSYYSSAEAEAIKYAYDNNVLVVCSGGNTGSGEYHYPASYPGALSVSALDYSSKSGYSIFSSSTYNDEIDIAAPGKSLYGVSHTNNTSLAALGKTSAAAPYVAGIAALILSVDRTITAKECINIITSTATDKGASGYDKRYGYGIINPLAAVKKAAKKTVTISSSSYIYNGKTKTPSVTVKDRKGKVLKKNTDYTVTYSSGRKNVGKYNIKVTFKGNYSGTVTKTFTIKPKNTSISKVTAGKKKFTVKWKKQATQTTGYQIQYSTSSKFTSGTTKTVTVSKNKTTSKTISKLKAKKKYYVRIRTYKTVSGTKYYSSWSKAKAVTTKK